MCCPYAPSPLTPCLPFSYLLWFLASYPTVSPYINLSVWLLPATGEKMPCILVHLVPAGPLPLFLVPSTTWLRLHYLAFGSSHCKVRGRDGWFSMHMPPMRAFLLLFLCLVTFLPLVVVCLPSFLLAGPSPLHFCPLPVQQRITLSTTYGSGSFLALPPFC